MSEYCKNCKNLADQLDQLRTDLTAANTIIERLPKTADGVRVVPGDTVYAARNPSDDTVSAFKVCDYANWKTDAWGTPNVARAKCVGGGGMWVISRCYSTREAAEAAREGGEG